MRLADKVATMAKSGGGSVPAIHFMAADDGGRIIVRQFDEGCKFAFDIMVIKGTKSYILGNGGSNGQFVQYSMISKGLASGERGIFTLDDGGDGIYVGATRTYAFNYMNFHLSELTFGSYRYQTGGNRMEFYLFGCQVRDSNDNLIANFVPSKSGEFAALTDTVQNVIYAADKTNECEFVMI